MATLWRRLLQARPRRVENRVAEELTKWSAERGDHWVFERRPAMGRTGPDIEPNPYNFVIDVKSRRSISNKPFRIVDSNRGVKWYVRDEKSELGGWYLCRLDHLDVMLQMTWELETWHSIVVDGWLEHMRDWANQNSGMGMLVLHKPRKPIGSSIVILKASDWLGLMEGIGLI